MADRAISTTEHLCSYTIMAWALLSTSWIIGNYGIIIAEHKGWTSYINSVTFLSKYFFFIFNLSKDSLVINYLVTLVNEPLFYLSLSYLFYRNLYQNFGYILVYRRSPRYILNILSYRWLKALRKKNNSFTNPNRFNCRR